MEENSNHATCGDNQQERRLTLRKGEKLRHKSLVGRLFSEGKSIYDFPVRLVWRALSKDELDANFRAVMPERL